MIDTNQKEWALLKRMARHRVKPGGTRAAAVSEPRTLYQHQSKVVDHLQTHHGIIALHSTGAGKTLTSIASAKSLLGAGIVTRVIVLVNKSIIGQFMSEVVRVDPGLQQSFTIMTPHKFVKHDHGDLRECMLIVDEAHHFNRVANVTTATLVRAAKACARVLLLTGTLYTNELYDIVPVVAMARGTDPMRRSEFQSQISTEGTRFLETFLRGCVSVYMIDKNRDSHYPTVIEHIVQIKASQATRTAIRTAKRGPFYIGERKFALGTCGDVKDNRGLIKCCEKCAWALERLPAWIERGEKTIMFTPFVDAGVRVLQKMINDMGVNCVVIDGATSALNRTKYANTFNRPVEVARTTTPPTHEPESDSDDDPDASPSSSGRVGLESICGPDNSLFYRTTVVQTGRPREFTYHRMNGAQFHAHAGRARSDEHPIDSTRLVAQCRV